MKYIKTYETVIEPEFGDEPEVGDYVICEEFSVLGDFSDLTYYISSHIGKFIRYTEASDGWRVCRGRVNQHDYPYLIEYENIPEEMNVYFRNGLEGETCRGMRLSEIKYWSKNKKELEAVLIAKNYNL